MNKINLEDKIILAIDGLNIQEAKLFLERCPNIKWVKVGLELFTREGPNVIKFLKDLNKKIFLDLKFHDIPNTMEAACYEVSKLGVDIISVHASSGYKALTSSKNASLDGANLASVNPPNIVGITVLTSFSSEEFRNDLDRKNSIEENVVRLAKLCFDAGLDGCVCSPWEAKRLRSIYKNNFELITPGIRTKTQNKDDQNRIMTPYEALKNGASRLVIGRAISKAKDPNKVFLDICNSIY
ncbi:orotidine 5'-phosphate decarboxylase [Prochlorococcus marinus str. MIT 9515]|uniref:Orotidine 5'-phosphate decarboxylase n=1 Tax=Prochlorococcus marinus (strain MIT 9515) TaxID=167542 RepID=PYRF_PROM5|nr:orotidine-5'-phosphate decarboxylase [Prochlorococcus marinus]A2BY35.1 RecName: Full=Orotidine 5'-phosphate decarboxylase; AltName: Full=OMP decarboxylase; Short=OMPDCase; Short=OMPdecase [Prochlorococcus marinus str. MIT 9515]ABM72696.1 orotidine 5'-phosphate decarboxylase [Prochlorococcus marinus str. MIT 9515]